MAPLLRHREQIEKCKASRKTKLVINDKHKDGVIMDSTHRKSGAGDDSEDDGSEVSEHNCSLPSEDEAIDGMIDNPHVNTTSDVNATTGPGHGISDDNSILHAEYGDDEPPPKLPPVSEPLAKIISKWLRVTPSRDEIKLLFRDCLLPENVEGLQPVRNNEILYQNLPFNAKLNDQKLRGINTYITRSLGPLVKKEW